MGWTTRGTVNVVLNSAVVTGVGSLFLQDGRIGDGFRGPDGRIYEVTNIATNTGLTIQPPYEGPTVNNATYFLAPFEGYVKDTADALRAASLEIGMLPATKQDKSDNLTAFSALTGAADRMPYFTGVGALALATLTSKARDLLAAPTDTLMRDVLLAESTIPIQVATSQINLNTLVTKRTDYYINDGINTPVAANGYLTVIPLVGGTECHQTYRRIGGVHGTGTYERTQYGGSWSAWQPVVTGTKVASATDSTADRIMTTGFQGLGGPGPSMANWDEDFKKGCGFFQANAAAPGGPGPAGYNTTGVNLVLNNGPIGGQIAVFNGDNRMVFRSAYNAFLPWMEVVHSGNATADPAVNAGGLMFYGANANGEFWKYANGMLICKVRRTFNIALTSQSNGVFAANCPEWVFPVSFVGDLPMITQNTGIPGYATIEGANIPSNGYVQGSIYSMASIPSTLCYQGLMAVGRWK